MAANLGISIQTARSHLKRIMQKTGTTRQAELVLLLSGLSALGDGGKNP
ncbi:LuxR family transcriptional regulator [Mycobacterium tuberculosis]|nr:LuxR family transcriptional regulator [Mycobacterium tuberculosis]